MRRLLWLLLFATSVMAQSGIGGGGQSNVSGGGSASPGSPGTVGGGASPIMAFYLGSNCPTANTGQCFNSPADTQQVNDCSWTSGSPTVNCATSHFVAADVGKQVMGWDNCNASSGNAGSLQMGLNPITTGTAVTILTFNSTTSVALSANAANSVAGNTHCFIWGHPDDAAAVAVEAAYDVSLFCPRLELQSANYLFASPHFYTQPTACANLGVNFTPSTVGNTYYSAGFELEGRGMGATNIYLATNFPNGDTCTHQDAGAVGSGHACFLLQVGAKWSNFQITGGSNATPAMTGAAATPKLIETISENTIEDVMLTNFAAFDVTHVPTGILANYQLMLKQVDNSGWGYDGLDIVSGRGPVTGILFAVENSLDVNVGILGPSIAGGYSFQCFSCIFTGTYATAANTIDVFNAGGSFYCDGCLFHDGLTQTTSFMYRSTAAGSTAYIRDSTMTNTSGNAAANGIICVTGACTNYLQNTSLVAGASGKTYSDVAGSKLIDLGGNSGFSSGGGVSISGSVFGSSSITGTALVNGNVVLSTCGTSAVSAPSGTSQAGQFTITFAGTPGTACTWTLTYPVAFLVAPLCTFTAVGGTNVFPTSIVNGTVNATTAAATETATAFTNGNTEIIQYRCQNP